VRLRIFESCGGFRVRRVFVVVSIGKIWLFLAVACPAFAQSNAGAVNVVVSNETVPLNATATIKLFLSAPQALSSGYIRLIFNGGNFPAQPPAIAAATVFSVSGDVRAVAAAEQASGSGFRIFFFSPSSGVGRVPGLPIAEFSIPVSAAFTVALDLTASYFYGPAGRFAVTATPGGVLIGGELSIQQVKPATGIVPAGSTIQVEGTGFASSTTVAIDGVALAGLVAPSSKQIEVTLAGATEVTGKHIHLQNPDGTSLDYWGGLASLYTAPLTESASGSCTIQGPPLGDPVQLVFENPNAVPAQVTVTNAFIPGSKPGTVTDTIPAGANLALNINDPADSTFQTSASTPLRATCFYTEQQSDLSILTWPAVILQGTPPSLGWIANGASFSQTAVAPGEIVTLFGTSIGPQTPASYVLDNSGKISTQLSGVQVLFNGTAAPLLYASASQVNAIVPYQVAGANVSSVQVTTNGSAAEWDVPVAPGAPGIFTLFPSLQAAVLNQDNSVNSPSNPAARGSVIQIFATGEGMTSPPGITGEITGTDLKQPQLPVSVSIGATTAQLTYFGSAPEAVTGLFQVNAIVASGVATGPAVSMMLTVGSASSLAATIAVK
jgi:uncharacterized protein (TIGR03437 family)